MNQTKIYRLPPAFYADHVARALPAGRLLRETSRFVEVELDEADYEELLSDAEYYSDPGMAADMRASDPAIFGLQSSARATVRRLKAEPFGPRPEGELQTFVFANPIEGAKPRTFTITTRRGEADARRQAGREIPASASWPLAETR